jgi:hypothetical protein
MELSRGDNIWVLASDPAPPAAADGWVACVMVGEAAIPLAFAESATQAALAARCPLIAIVAPNAEEVHDHIDWIVEDHEAFHTITTFHSGPDALDDAVLLVATWTSASPGRVQVFSKDPAQVESQLRSMGFEG